MILERRRGSRRRTGTYKVERRAEKCKTGGEQRTGQKLRARRTTLEVCPIAQRYGSKILGRQGRDGCRDILKPTRAIPTPRRYTDRRPAAFFAVEAVLVDEAAVWYESVEHKIKTWQDFERRFRRSFASQATTDELLTELRQRTQGKGEPISTYLNNFRFLCSRFRVPLPYENQLAIAFRGIRPEYRILWRIGQLRVSVSWSRPAKNSRA
ncbi:unnamed protein product [Trichogramma brassicae]|uniref:Retrotransposon gag domain-containing protein n=1 Tax=Trichogramma brassicae TaxID=86971 RepID=A0A6H5J9D7_9HYME|nr:unnamed protein product [Trichogramma brassicae]